MQPVSGQVRKLESSYEIQPSVKALFTTSGLDITRVFSLMTAWVRKIAVTVLLVPKCVRAHRATGSASSTRVSTNLGRMEHNSP